MTLAVVVDCPHEPQFLLNMAVAQSASVVAGRTTCQARSFMQKGEVPDNVSLETAAKRLLPHGYSERYSLAILEQLKAWEAFRMLNIGRRENPPMPKGMSHRQGVPELSFMGRHLKSFQGALP